MNQGGVGRGWGWVGGGDPVTLKTSTSTTKQTKALPAVNLRRTCCYVPVHFIFDSDDPFAIRKKAEWGGSGREVWRESGWQGTAF